MFHKKKGLFSNLADDRQKMLDLTNPDNNVCSEGTSRTQRNKSTLLPVCPKFEQERSRLANYSVVRTSKNQNSEEKSAKTEPKLSTLRKLFRRHKGKLPALKQTEMKHRTIINVDLQKLMDDSNQLYKRKLSIEKLFSERRTM